MEKVTEKLNEKSDFKYRIEQVSISWLDEAALEGVSITDPENNEMIKVSRLMMDFNLLSLLTDDEIRQDVIILENPTVLLKTIVIQDSVQTLNINQFIKEFKRKPKDSSAQAKSIYINDIFVSSGRFQYENPFAAKIEKGFDPNHFIFDSISFELNDFQIRDSLILMQIRDLGASESNTGLRFDPIYTDFTLAPTSMSFKKLDATVGASTIGDSLVFSYKKMTDFNDFLNKVHIDAHLENSVIDKDDLQSFFPDLVRYPEYARISGDFSGTITNFNFLNSDVLFGKRTHLKGNVEISGLPNINETFINIDLKNSEMTLEDIEPITHIAQWNVPDPGKMLLSASFTGYATDFVTFGRVETKFGEIRSDINLKFPEGQPAEYDGKLKLNKFQLGAITENEDLGIVNFDGSLTGQGFKLENADLEVQGNLSSLEYKGYRYVNIYSDGRLARQSFNGKINIDDPNVRFSLDGSVNLKKGKEKLKFNTQLDTLFLDRIGFSEKLFFLSGNGKVDIEGLSPDEMIGNMKLYDIKVITDSSTLILDSLNLLSEIGQNDRNINLESDLINAQIKGEFKPSTLYKEFDYLYKIYRGKLLSETNLPKSIYNSDSTYNQFNYQVEIVSLNPLFDLFIPGIELSEQTEISGNYSGGKTKILNLYTDADSIKYYDYTFHNIIFEINSSITQDNRVLAMMYLNSENQELGTVKTENMLLEAIWDKKHIDFELNTDQPLYSNRFNLIGDLDFINDSTIIDLQKSGIRLLENPWDIGSDSRITIHEGSVNIENFSLTSQGQGLYANGILSERPEDQLIVKFDSLELANFNSLIQKELKGKLDGNIEVSEFFGKTMVENELSITQLFINNFKVGNVFGEMQWDRNIKQFDLAFHVNYNKERTMDLQGYYRPDEENQLDIDAELVQTQINILEPFIGSYFSELNGTATGNFKITGTPLSPKIDGRGDLENAKATIVYLKTAYDIKGGFTFSEDKIFLKDIRIIDKFSNRGSLSGTIDHGGFRDMSLDLKGNYTRLLLLNTGPDDNSLYYGEAFGTGDISFSGPSDNLTVAVNARTEKGTEIYIPVEGTETIETSEFISFVNFEDTLAMQRPTEQELDLSGLILDMNLDITPDAYAEIIFDIKAGDIIRGRGNGDISLNIDTNGEFNMFGELAIEEGWYNFTLYNLINKEFIIQPGGTINWFGDPYEGIMNLTATYNQIASIGPILEPEYREASEVNRKYPTKVIMDLEGPLLNPEISFDLEAENLPRNVVLSGEAAGQTIDLDFQFQSFINSIDEQELKRQVFSLIVLRRFSTPASFNTGGAISGSVSELFSNQLSYWMSQVDSNLEVDFDVDLSSFDEESFNTFQLRLSYAFLDGRLRVTRDGDFTNNQQQVNFTSLAGNWTVEYLLTQDGKVKVKMYSRNNNDNLNLDRRNNSNTTGASLQYTQSFNTFMGALNRLFSSSKEDQEEEDSNDNSEEESSSELPDSVNKEAKREDETR